MSTSHASKSGNQLRSASAPAEDQAKRPECSAPSPAATMDAEPRRKPTAIEVWEALVDESMQDEIDRILAKSPEQIEKELVEAGFDLEEVHAKADRFFERIQAGLRGEPAGASPTADELAQGFDEAKHGQAATPGDGPPDAIRTQPPVRSPEGL
jgi:hypothetical protein